MTTKSLGQFRSQNNRFSGYWQETTGRVYLKLENGSFRTSLVEAGNAFSEGEARLIAEAAVSDIKMNWA